MRFLRILFAVIGALLIADSVIIAALSNYNLGVIMPAILGAPLVFLALMLPRMNSGFLLVLKWLIISGYCVASVVFIVCGILMVTAAHRSEKVEADVLIVLGAALHGDRVTWVLSNRLDTASDYLDGHPSAVAIVTGGQGPGEDIPEAIGMRQYLIDRKGIQPERILAEDQAESTFENFAFSKQLIEQKLGKDLSVAFVTTDFHVFRAGRVAHAAGLEAVGIPAPDVWYIRINNFFRECIGICVYALRGQL